METVKEINRAFRSALNAGCHANMACDNHYFACLFATRNMFLRSRLIRFVLLQYYCVVLVGAPIPIAIGKTARQTTEPEQAFPCAGGDVRVLGEALLE